MANKSKRGLGVLSRRVFNTPQLVTADTLQIIAQALVSRANGELVITSKEKESLDDIEIDYKLMSDDDRKAHRQRQLGISNDGSRGNLNITGTLVYKAGQIDGDCMELTSYERLVSTAKAQIDEGVSTIIMHVDSGGGEAYGCFESAREVRNYADENNVQLIAYVDGLSASAAYAWTSVAHEVVSNPSSEIGSVGVVVQLINNSKMLENIGITRQFVYNGDQKIPFDANGDFSPQFLSNIQKKVDKTGLEFNTFVATNRNMAVNDVIATQAEVFDADEALKVGFIDKLMERSEFFNNYLPNAKSNSNNTFLLKTEDKMSQKLNDEVTVEVLQAQLQTEQEKNKTLTTDLEKANSKLSELSGVKSSLDATALRLSELQASYDSLISEQEEKEKLAKQSARKEKLATALGKDNEQLDSLVDSFQALSDEQFDIVAASYNTSVEKKADSFAEKGGEGSESNLQLSMSEKLALRALNK